MKKLLAILLCCAFALLLTACACGCIRNEGGAPPYIAGETPVSQPPTQCEYMEKLPKLSITQTYHDARTALESGERVLVLFLDGWGWYMFRYFEDKQPFLAGLNPQPALAAYPPITPVGLATVITGVRPEIHGIQSRNDRRMNDGVTDIFETARELGARTVYVQGHTNPIATSLVPILSPGTDGPYGTDGNVFENARRNLDADFLFVHFHGIDDDAHSYGPYAPEVGARMALIDEYVRYLVENWGSGVVIITADHGLHRIYDNPYRLGDHYKFCHENMIVPYVVITV